MRNMNFILFLSIVLCISIIEYSLFHFDLNADTLAGSVLRMIIGVPCGFFLTKFFRYKK